MPGISVNEVVGKIVHCYLAPVEKLSHEHMLRRKSFTKRRKQIGKAKQRGEVGQYVGEPLTPVSLSIVSAKRGPANTHGPWIGRGCFDLGLVDAFSSHSTGAII